MSFTNVQVLELVDELLNVLERTLPRINGSSFVVGKSICIVKECVAAVRVNLRFEIDTGFEHFLL